jgi:hypothetical protein
MPRRFPPPWSINEMHGVCFIVCDKNGQQLGYFYYENESGHQRTATNLLTRGEAWKMAANFAKLPDRSGARAWLRRVWLRRQATRV